VLELPRGGKMRAQDAAVREARGEIVAFSDANAMWEPGALRALVAAFRDQAVAYACGQVRFVNAAGTNQEGVYWRYEMWLREHESVLASITAGNGAIYAVRRGDYVEYDPPMGHDLSFPFAMVKRGRCAVYVPEARATEAMVPTIEGEWARKRRMMNRAWQIVLVSGISDLRGYPPLYAAMIVSHRLLRYASPFLHGLALVASLALSRRRLYRAAAAAQFALLAAAAAGQRIHARPLLIARYYVLTTASIAAGLADHLRHGTPAGWEQAEGTRV
jgi:cellulose synthase/poly-beta-1,6-N-acetylglucosamine synthase-like glycosyltransferase